MQSLLRRRIFSISGAVAIAAVLATHVFAASSTNYTVPADTPASVGGGSSSSTNYKIPKSSDGTSGGTSNSTNYYMNAGVIFMDCSCAGIDTTSTCSTAYLADNCGVAGRCQGTLTCGGAPTSGPPPSSPPASTPSETPATSPTTPSSTPPSTSTPPPSETPTTSEQPSTPGGVFQTPGSSSAPVAPTYGPPEVPTPSLVPEPAGGLSGGSSGGGGGSTGDTSAGSVEPGRLSARDIIFALQFQTMRAVTEETPQGLKLNIYPGHPVSAAIPLDRIKKPVDRILLQVGEQYFQFGRDDQAYALEFPSPPGVGVYPMSIGAIYKDNSSDLINFLVEVRPPSLIFSYGSIIPEPDAVVTLYEKTSDGWRIFDASPYKQFNPQRTDAAGHYAFVVPPGTYYVATEKDGYFGARTNEFTTGSNVIESDVEIIKKPKSLPAVIRAIPRFVRQGTERVANNPVVEQATENVITPAVVATVVANAAVAVPAFSMLSYLQYIVTQPLWLFRRKKRHGWGVVFNSLTKMPVDLVIVRLLDAQSNRVIATRVTDRGGRYAFIAPEGHFKIQVQKQGFVYPTRYLKGKNEDLEYTELYEGEAINAKQGAVVAVNIAMDPVEKMVIPSEVMWKYRKQKIQMVISLSGIAFAGIACVIAPTLVTVGVLGGHILLYGLCRRLAYPNRPKSWGVVYDAGSKEPVGQAIVRIFETKFNKLLESWPTDARGRYSFLVGNNMYYVTVEKPGYNKYQSDQIDLRSKPSVINFDIPIKHE